MTTDTAEETGVVLKTTDYNKFLTMQGNRSVDMNHVKHLKIEMENNRELFQSLPILVNESWYIVDGQHRFEAAKQLGLPIYYIMQKRVGLEATRRMNIAQRRWTMKDFALSYADSGRPDYIELVRTAHQYKKIPLSLIVMCLAGEVGGGSSSSAFQRGEFKVKDKSDALEILDFLSEVMDISGQHLTNTFVAAIMRLLKGDEFNQMVFLNKLRENPDALVMSQSLRSSLRNIEEIYNRHNKTTIRLY